MSKNFYITTSIAYTNAPPHIGFALELLQADVLARYKREKGFRVFFLTGTDEHGLKIYKKAKEQNKDPQDFVNEMAFYYRVLIEKLNISNDFFIRTTDEDIHLEGVQKAWKKLEERGDIYKKKYKGLYCVGCEAFLKEKDLVDGLCPDHHKEPEAIEEENYFFKLSKYSQKIESAIKEDRVKIIPNERKNEILSFLKEKTEDISISRSKEKLPWGIPVPGDESQVIYVWFDALLNYITALGYKDGRDFFKNFWPADVHCIGKDISRFHSVIWPAILLSLELDLPKNIFVHGHITCGGKKMSKTVGNIIDPFELIKKYGQEAVRYYFLREIPTTGDGDFSHERFIERYNSDLADGIGNLTSRVVSMAKKKNIDTSKEKILSSMENLSESVKKEIEKTEKEVERLIESYSFNEALESIWNLIHFADRYIEEKKPWEKKEESEIIVSELACLLYFLSEKISLFLPQTGKNIKKQLETKNKETLFQKVK